MPNETISVPEIHCDHCKMSIEGAVNALPGVDLATVDVPNATVTVEYDQSSVSREDIVSAIEEQGYDVPA